MPQFRFPRLTPTVKVLLIVLGAAFVTVAVLDNLVSLGVFRWLALDLSFGLEPGPVNLAWQPLTYWLVWPAVPDVLLPVLLTLLMVYFFLCPFEEGFGPKRTLQLVAAGVLGAAIPCILLALVVTPVRPIYGADCVALAAFGAFPIVHRGREILFMFVIPMKAWTVLLLGVAFAVLSALLARDPFILTEYLGALGAGMAFAKWMTRPRSPRPPKKGKGPKRRSGPALRVVRGGADDDKPKWLN